MHNGGVCFFFFFSLFPPLPQLALKVVLKAQNNGAIKITTDEQEDY